MHGRQCCNQCKGPLKLGGGALCPACRRAAELQDVQLEPGSLGRQIAARHADRLLAMVSDGDTATATLLQTEVQPQSILVSAAAHELAAAWGVKCRKLRA